MVAIFATSEKVVGDWHWRSQCISLQSKSQGYERVDGHVTLLAVNLFEQTESLSCSIWVQFHSSWHRIGKVEVFMSFCSWFVIVSRTKCDNDSNQAIIFAVLVRQSPEGEKEIIIF